ncbi:MAG: hypothetical protein ABWY66_12200, partial [Xanthobacteraceae bacterium]
AAALRSAPNALVRLEPNTVVQRGELRIKAAPQLSPIPRKALMALAFRAVIRTGQILDSPTPGQYGPRGF